MSVVLQMLSKLQDASVAQKVAIVLLLGGLGLLLVEVRFEHQAVLAKKWQAWIPLVYTTIMLFAGPLGLYFWNRGGRILLCVGFALAPVLGLLGFWFHSKADPWLALSKVCKVIWMMPGKIPLDVDGPPVLAPLALTGLGMLGLVICLTGCSNNKQATGD